MELTCVPFNKFFVKKIYTQWSFTQPKEGNYIFAREYMEL